MLKNKFVITLINCNNFNNLIVNEDKVHFL